MRRDVAKLLGSHKALKSLDSGSSTRNHYPQRSSGRTIVFRRYGSARTTTRLFMQEDTQPSSGALKKATGLSSICVLGLSLRSIRASRATSPNRKSSICPGDGGIPCDGMAVRYAEQVEAGHAAESIDTETLTEAIMEEFFVGKGLAILGDEWMWVN